VTVALVSIAEGMAYALVAGVDPVYGLYAGSVSVLVGSLMASSSMLVITATNALALVAADHIGALGDDVDPATAMFTLTVLVGAVMAGLGLARLGSVVRFISAEVQAGLVAAVALLIVLGQYDELVGYTSDATAMGGGKVIKAARHHRARRPLGRCDHDRRHRVHHRPGRGQTHRAAVVRRHRRDGPRHRAVSARR
jgi:SulP family sulfate permease